MRRPGASRAHAPWCACDPQVLLDGKLVAKSDRSAGSSLLFYAPSMASSAKGASAKLSIVVEAVGRSNGGCDWDFKGLQSGNITLNGALHLVRILCHYIYSGGGVLSSNPGVWSVTQIAEI